MKTRKEMKSVSVKKLVERSIELSFKPKLPLKGNLQKFGESLIVLGI